MTALDEYQINQALSDLMLQFQNTMDLNLNQRDQLVLNESATLGDYQRSFDRQAPKLGVPYARRGLETSGIRDQGIGQVKGDFQRNYSRAAEGFTNQYNAISNSDLNNQRTLSEGVANTEAYASARRSEIATNIQGL